MKKIDQRKIHDPDNGSVGDCWKACLASIMEFPYEAVPQFELGKSYPEMRLNVDMWLSLFKKCAKYHDKDSPPEGYSIAIGTSDRFPREVAVHCCVALDGKVVHDPHPDDTGLTEIDYYETLDDIKPMWEHKK